MKKKINGRTYNTETAKRIAGYSTDCSTREHWYFEETLYVKRTGEFFLHGEGAERSEYATYNPDDMSTGCGEQILPMTIEQVRKWAKKRGIDVECLKDSASE